jgi:HSP20 family molecular chaperone IbpA
MSQVANKSLLLSRPKSAQFEGTPVVTLPHTSTLTDSTTEIKIEVPGVDPSTVEVQFEENTLFVKCERGELTLPVNPTIDTTKIKADILWGMLTLTVPLPTPPEAHSIKVSVHDAVKKAPAKVTREE